MEGIAAVKEKLVEVLRALEDFLDLISSLDSCDVDKFEYPNPLPEWMVGEKLWGVENDENVNMNLLINHK